jgi:predicted lipoprotein with Yx(FWY)xxD motif
MIKGMVLFGLGVSSLISTPSFGRDNAGAVLHFRDHLLVEANELTVYVFDKDATSQSTCYQACARNWPAVLAPTESTPLPTDVTITQRTDGTRQLVYKGRPVYRYFSDTQAGDKKGDGLGGVWHVISESDENSADGLQDELPEMIQDAPARGVDTGACACECRSEEAFLLSIVGHPGRTRYLFRQPEGHNCQSLNRALCEGTVTIGSHVDRLKQGSLRYCTSTPFPINED